MSITFCIESRGEREDDALAAENAPELNVHNAGGFALLDALGIEADHYGTIAAADLLARLGRPITVPAGVSPGYINRNLAVLCLVAAAAQRIGRQVVWG